LQDLLLHLHTRVMLRCKIFSCTCTHAWCYVVRASLHEFDHGVWVDLFLCCCPFVLALQSSNKNRDVKRNQSFKYIANVEGGYKIVMTTINLSVEIFTSMCYPECLRQSRMSQVGCDPKKFGIVSDDNAWLKIWIKKLACRRAPTKVRNVVLTSLVRTDTASIPIRMTCVPQGLYDQVSHAVPNGLTIVSAMQECWCLGRVKS